jgi:hypothetical protein
MTSDVNELCVFIASPGDLKEEREALRSLEARLNSKFAPASIRVRMTGWEERPPAYGRPQSQINPMVDECDVFVGLLRRKWGSRTGTHDSGFGEEFERALGRRQNSGMSPEISLFFAQLSQDEIDDAGPDLTRVLAFQQRVQAERIGIYSKFSDPEDLGRQVGDLLERHLINLVVSQGVSDAPAGPESKPENEGVPPSSQVDDVSTDDDQQDDARSQLSRALGTLQDVLSEREPTHPLDRDRLELIGTALGLDAAGLGTHLANRLYRRRDELELIVAEHSAWVRTLFGDIGRTPNAADRVIPGWAIIEPRHESFAVLMVRLAMESGAVGLGAVRSMQRLGMRPATLWPPPLRPGQDGGEDPGDDVRLDNWTNLLNRHKGRSAGVTYLLQDLDTEDPVLAGDLDIFLGAIQVQRGDLNDESRQLIANSRAALAGDPTPLAESLGYSSEDNAPWRLVIRQIEKLDQKRLNQLASQKFNHVAQMASLRAGITMNALSDGTVKKLLFQDDPIVTEVLLEAAKADTNIARRYLSLLEDKPEGELKPTGLEALLLAQTATQSELEVLEQEERFSNVPWEALTHLDPDGMAESARTALRTNVSDLRDRLLALIGEEHAVIDFLADDRKRIAAALLARRKERSAEDVDLVLEWFEQLAASGFVHDFAFDTVQRLADESTLGRITEILTRHQDSTGVRAAYDRIHGPLAPAFASLFLDHETQYFREPSMLWHIAQEQRSVEELKEALYDKSDKVRAVATETLASRLTDDEAKVLLEEYPNAGRAFWYNVIAILDEHVYAPSTPETN